jgi:glutamyl-tRNA synthetase
MKEKILKYALLNAVQYQGKANLKAVVGKLLSENPELKNNIVEVMRKTNEVIKEINNWGLEKQKQKIQELGFEIEDKSKKEEFELPELPGAIPGQVVTAFPPEPSKFPHLGHAKTALVNYLYSQKYKGQFILRFEDTNPDFIKKKYYEAIMDGLSWLGIKWDGLDCISSHIKEYYKVVNHLIKKEKAYVCFCSPEQTKKNRRKMEECECRKKPAKENFKKWEGMLSGEIKEGEATVRLKISMQHKNAAMRDPAIMRIIERIHPRTENKYRVWPTYDFGTALMDSWERVTHRIRTKEFELRRELQSFIQQLLGFPVTYIDEIARFNLKGIESSGRKIRELISTGKFIDCFWLKTPPSKCC